MSYAEVVRFISVQPFPLQRHHLSLSLSLHFSRIRSFASPIFSCPTRLTPPLSPSLHLFSLISYPRPFRAFSSSFRSFHHPFLPIFFSPTPKIALSFRPFGHAHFSRTIERNIAISAQLPSSDGIFDAPPA